MAEKPSTDWTNIQWLKYPGYGICIYCGSDGGDDGLRDEHIIPLSLNGNAIIKNASCTDCEKKINPADTHLAKSIFWNLRLHIGAQTRNTKERPNVLTAKFTIGEKEVLHDLPAQDFPFAIALPNWGPAGFFRSASIDAPFPKSGFHIYYWEPPNITDTLGITDGEDFKVWSSAKVNMKLFARAIAKIAYCHTVIYYGLHGFRRLALPDVILGKCPAAAYFVGAPLKQPPPPLPGDSIHMVQGIELNMPQKEVR